MMVVEKGINITERIINLAHDLGLDVVAEGVEIEEQLSILKELNWDIIQGYIYGRPLSETDTYAYLDKHKV